MLEAVARFGGMNRAAEELKTVQSNVTARIKHLEEEVGLNLRRSESRSQIITQT